MTTAPRRLVADLRASVTVALVALPLCLGVAVASGAPPVTGLVTGIVGGLLVGFLPGSRLQVSGPAAGLVVLVHGLVTAHGLAVLGPVVAVAGLLQLGMAALRLAGWFRAVALPVVHGMLAGIGLLIVVGQLLVLVGASGTGSGPRDLVRLPSALAAAVSGGLHPALLSGGLALAVLLAWARLPARWQVVPGALVAVLVGTTGTLLAGWDPARIELPDSPADLVSLPTAHGLAMLADPVVLGSAVAIALVASAESLLSAVAVDRMHLGPTTRFDAELAAQGVGNTVAGLLGGLPMTAVVVRSAANVRAGARTRASRVLHGVWLLLAVLLLAGALSRVPVAVLAAVLVVVGAGLISPHEVRDLARTGRDQVALYLVTLAGVFCLGLLEGVFLGLALAGVLLLRRLVGVEVVGGAGDVVVTGAATFLAVPRLAAELESRPVGSTVRVDLSGASLVDPAVQDLVAAWRVRHEALGGTVEVVGPSRV